MSWCSIKCQRITTVIRVHPAGNMSHIPSQPPSKRFRLGQTGGWTHRQHSHKQSSKWVDWSLFPHRSASVLSWTCSRGSRWCLLFMLKGQPGSPGIKGAPGSQGPRGVQVSSWTSVTVEMTAGGEHPHLHLTDCLLQGPDGKDGFGPPGPKGVKVEFAIQSNVSIHVNSNLTEQEKKERNVETKRQESTGNKNTDWEKEGWLAAEEDSQNRRWFWKSWDFSWL